MPRAIFGLFLLSALVAPQASAKGWSWFGTSQEKVTKPTHTRAGTPTSIVVAPSMLVADGGVAPGVLAQFSTAVVPGTPLFFTAELAPYFYSTYFDTKFAIATLLGMDYRFTLPHAKVRPLFGVNFGPVFGRRVTFGMLFRPGVDFPIRRDIELNFEMRFGVVASSFVFLPQFGVRFVL